MLTTNLANKRLDVSDRSNILIDRTTKKVDQIQNAFLAILESAEAISILDHKLKVGRSGVNWVYYRNKYGKKIATFISPKEFRGYWWSKDYSTTVNLATGAKYQVSSLPRNSKTSSGFMS